MKILKAKKGLSLVEMVLYFGLTAVVVIIATTFAIQILKASFLSNNFHELQTNVDFIAEKIAYSIQSATRVDATGSVFDNDVGTLSLTMPEASKSPTKIYFSDGEVYFKEGSGAAVKISSDFIKFETLRFHRVVYPKAKDQIIVDALVLPINDEISEVRKNVELHFSVSLRN